VVIGAVDQHGSAPKVGDDPAHVRIEVGFHLGANKRLAILRAEQGVG